MGRFGDKPLFRALHADEVAYLKGGNRDRLPERAAGRWALKEAFGKALGVGLDGWTWRELRYRNGRLWAEGTLAEKLQQRGITGLFGSVTHDGGLAIAVVVLER